MDQATAGASESAAQPDATPPPAHRPGRRTAGSTSTRRTTSSTASPTASAPSSHRRSVRPSEWRRPPRRPTARPRPSAVPSALARWRAPLPCSSRLHRSDPLRSLGPWRRAGQLSAAAGPQPPRRGRCSPSSRRRSGRAGSATATCGSARVDAGGPRGHSQPPIGIRRNLNLYNMCCRKHERAG
jgi:hypothetical protein